MTVRYEHKEKYLFEWQKEFKLSKYTIIKPQVKIKFEDLGFEHFKFKTITQFNVLLLKKKNDILTFNTLTEDWSLDLIINEDMIIKIQIEYYWKRHQKKVNRHMWEEFIEEKN